MESLPLEMTREILLYLEAEDLLRAKRTSKRMQNLANRIFWNRYHRDVLLPNVGVFRDDIKTTRSENDSSGGNVYALSLYPFGVMQSMRTLRDVFHHWGKGGKPQLSLDRRQHPLDFDEWDVLSFRQHKRESSPKTTTEEVDLDFGKYFEGITVCMCHDPYLCCNVGASGLVHDYCWGGCRPKTPEQSKDFIDRRFLAKERWVALLGDLISEELRVDANRRRHFYE